MTHQEEINSMTTQEITEKYNQMLTGIDKVFPVKGRTNCYKCTSCDKEFDIEDITYDGDDNPFCPECWKVLAPDMKAEYEELKANGEIE